ncbi:LysR family transcriptional regulator [Aureimonas altamirensis]|uniref:LysR family transcriptional regulator n=1 Tax=Aureimonas altamirensis TaxID=370622 RepID=UPI00301663ED
MEQKKRRLPALKSLLFLECVVRTGSVTAAADELSITHSAVSKQLSQLESWLDVPLFVEKRKGMIPSQEIARLAKVLETAFDDIHEALAELRPSKVATSNLKVIAPATFAMRWLMPKLPDLHAAAQPVNTSVRPTHTHDNWLEIPFDVAIRRGGTIPAHFAPQPLFTETLSLMVASHLVEEAEAFGPEDLARIGLIDVTTRPGELTAWLKAAGLPSRLARQALRLPHFYIGLDAMFMGRGALVVPSVLIEPQLKRGEVVEPFPQWRVSGQTYQVFANPASPAGDTGSEFIGWLRAAALSNGQGRFDTARA